MKMVSSCNTLSNVIVSVFKLLSMYPGLPTAMEPLNEVPINIDVTDDELNEAQEQDFVAILTVETVINPNSFEYGRRSSLCRIIDNDRTFY